MSLRARDVLGHASPLARALPRYKEREAQLAMAAAVEVALTEERPLFVEAGTGTGKTLAYLVPAILSGKKVVISTATRALQEQIFAKDIPLVRAALATHGVTFRAVIMKGLTNYLCKRRLAELPATLGFAWADPDGASIGAWARETRKGDRAELVTLREDSLAWLNVQSSSETRVGVGCQYFEECFVTAMRREAEDAHVLVVNHHLFFADLALRSGVGRDRAGVLPAYDAVVFDEAHEVEDVATDFFGVRVSRARIEELARDAHRALGGGGTRGKGSSASPCSEQVALAARALFAAFVYPSGGGEARRILGPDDWSPEALAGCDRLDDALEALAGAADARSVGADAFLQIVRRARDAQADLREVRASARPPASDGEERTVSRVAWVRAGERTVSIGASPVELGDILRASLFDRVPTVVCTSATLATITTGAPSCHFARARLGAPPETRELVLASPFDFAARSALYLPRDMPEPSDPGFDAAVAERALALTRITGGGAFILCTSTRAMRRVHAALLGRVEAAPLLQGDAPKHVLLEKFKRHGDALLIATMSFWEGVDVPGRALRLVVIDKIPFAVPSDPVVMARSSAIERAGGNAFREYSVPSAAITLKQGFGRLLRSEEDVGIVAILDRRLTTRGYGRPLLESLPPARRVATLDEVRGFWAGVEVAHGGEGPPGPPVLDRAPTTNGST